MSLSLVIVATMTGVATGVVFGLLDVRVPAPPILAGVMESSESSSAIASSSTSSRRQPAVVADSLATTRRFSNRIVLSPVLERR